MRCRRCSWKSNDGMKQRGMRTKSRRFLCRALGQDSAGDWAQQMALAVKHFLTVRHEDGEKNGRKRTTRCSSYGERSRLVPVWDFEQVYSLHQEILLTSSSFSLPTRFVFPGSSTSVYIDVRPWFQLISFTCPPDRTFQTAPFLPWTTYRTWSPWLSMVEYGFMVIEV
jgi:hypothetical protein